MITNKSKLFLLLDEISEIYNKNKLYDFTSKSYLTLFTDDLNYFKLQLKNVVDIGMINSMYMELYNLKKLLNENLFKIRFFEILNEISNFITIYRKNIFLGG